MFGEMQPSPETLFSLRVVVGSLKDHPQDMYSSLNQKIRSLPPETRLYFGHEYTEKNLEFSLTWSQATIKPMCF